MKKIVSKIKNKLLCFHPVVNRGRNNLIRVQGKLIRSKIEIIGNNNIVDIAESATLCNVLVLIEGSNHQLHIGKNVHFVSGRIRFENASSSIDVGDGTTFGSVLLSCTEGKNIVIGKDCLFSHNVQIRVGDSHTIWKGDNRINNAQSIVIGDHVWVGSNAVILKGVQIGSGAIVGINSIVTKDVLEKSIVVGCNNRVIENDITWVRDRGQNY